MASKLTRADRAIVRLADGTVKQQNLLTGTEVWTVPGRGNRPLAAPRANHGPIDHEAHGRYCAFCSKRYLETPPEKSRLVRRDDGTWEQLDALSADKLSDTVAEFRRIPNLFEIVSYNYWHLSHGHVPSENDRHRMARYLASDVGYEHVMNVVRARMLASGMSEGEFAATRKLLIAQNEHAVALAGFGHRFPGIAIWPLHAPRNPWEVSDEAMAGISDILHAAHAATGAEVPANEEWYHRPPTVSTPMRWRILLKWRISTLAGFEGGTRIYLNTIDPWKVVERTVPRLRELRDRGLIAPMRIGDECRVSPSMLRD